MDFPFTAKQFMDIMVKYNTAVWPMQIILNALALFAVYLVFRKGNRNPLYISLILAFIWVWNGVMYHLIYFTSINNAAYLFGLLFVLQGILFATNSFGKNSLQFSWKPDITSFTGLIFIAYALLVYPVIGQMAGHGYPQQPTFGLPCPTTIFTFGLLLMNRKKTPLSLLIIPFLWSVIGFMAAVHFGIYEDSGLLIAGILGILILLIQNKKYGRVIANTSN